MLGMNTVRSIALSFSFADGMRAELHLIVGEGDTTQELGGLCFGVTFEDTMGAKVLGLRLGIGGLEGRTPGSY